MNQNKSLSNFRIPLRKLKRIRKEMKTTQAMVARFLNVSTQFYSQMERGVNVLSYSNAVKIAHYFQMSPDELFKEEFELAQKKQIAQKNK